MTLALVILVPCIPAAALVAGVFYLVQQYRPRQPLDYPKQHGQFAIWSRR